MDKPRILFFDLVRILAIFMIFITHLAVNETLELNTQCGINGIWYGSFGNFGVILILFVSGAVLEYNYGDKIRGKLETFNYRQFIKKRVIRIYPIFWASLFLGLIFNVGLGNAFQIPVYIYIIDFSGFSVFFFNHVEFINSMAWFIGIIMSLYFVFPLISEFLKKYGFQALFLILIASVAFQGTVGAYWNVAFRLFEFSLGIYIMQIGLYPKIENSSKTIWFISDLTFPVFMIHTVLLSIFMVNIPLYFAALIVFSILLYCMDMLIKKSVLLYSI